MLVVTQYRYLSWAELWHKARSMRDKAKIELINYYTTRNSQIRSKNNLGSFMYSYGPPHMAVQKQDDQHEHTFSNYVRIQDVVQKTCLRRWTIGKSGERGSGISVLPARHDDDDDDKPFKSMYKNVKYPHNQKVVHTAC